MPAASPRRQTDIVCRPANDPSRCVDRWDLLALVTSLRRELGLADRDIMVLRAHLSVLPKGPLDPAGVNVSFMCIREILERACGMDERRFRRGETCLERAGLVHRRLSGNGRRFPERDRTGRIVSAYGIDLAPLLARHDELKHLVELRHAQQLELRQRKNHISARLSAAIRTFNANGCPLPEWVETLRDKLRKLIRRKAPTLHEVNAVEVEIAQLEGLALAQDKGSKRLEMSRKSTISPDKITVDVGQTVRHIESKPKERIIDKRGCIDKTQLADAWAQTRVIREFYPECPNKEGDLATVIHDFSSFMKLENSTMGHALAVMGWENTVIVLDYLAERITAIKSPTAYLISMLNEYRRGNPIADGRVATRQSKIRNFRRPFLVTL